MSSYDFRLSFNFPESYRVSSDKDKLELLVLDSGQHLILHSGAFGKPIKDHPKADIRGGPFLTEAQARSAAEKSKRALLCWAVEQRLGIDFGEGKIRSYLTDAGLAHFQKQFKGPIRMATHDIDVYEHVDNLSFIGFNADIKLGKTSQTLIDTFSREYFSTLQISDKVLLAAEIYASSFFDVSPRSRFITLVTSVESLLNQLIRPDELQCLFNEFETKLHQLTIDPKTKNSIIGQLSNLKYQSIGEAARDLIHRLIPNYIFNGNTSKNFFTDCYHKRSQLIHNGVLDPSDSISELANEMERFVSLLLIKLLSSQPPSSDTSQSGQIAILI